MKTEIIADKIRAEVLRVGVKNQKGHIAPSLSCVDILTVLYYDVAKETDTVILSKGHGCYGLYAIQADKGVITQECWEEFRLPGCLDGYGSLGHGLPVGVGTAFGNKKLGNKSHTWVIVGDGELQEGSNWEAIQFMYHHWLKNLTIIVDYNWLQAMDRTDNILYGNIAGKFRGFGLKAVYCDGHIHTELKRELEKKPTVLIAETVKGYGYKFMENKAEWHYRVPAMEVGEE